MVVLSEFVQPSNLCGPGCTVAKCCNTAIALGCFKRGLDILACGSRRFGADLNLREEDAKEVQGGSAPRTAVLKWSAHDALPQRRGA